MSTIIYWACNENEWLRAKEPNSIYKDFIKNIKDKNTQIELCPSVKDYTKNTFSIKSLYDYNFEILKDTGQVVSNMYDQKFFDKHVFVRSNIDKLFSFSQSYTFFTEKKSLKMSANVFPYLEDNSITKTCIPVPGTFDIGKWFRATEFSFYLRDNLDKFNITQDEVYQYIKFHTDDKIIFKQFMISEKIKKYLLDVDFSKEYRKATNKSLQEYYFMLKHKKHIIKEIKSNLI
jgi:hypothetical protein